jgi:C_GCAxxG_C_C family probable redox protein
VTSSVSQRSRELFDLGYFCGESVLLAVAEAEGIESDLIPKIATGFCSGVARTCGTCGALSGAIMVINLFAGRSSPEKSVDENYRLVRRLLDDFEAKFGSTSCRDLTGCDLGVEEGQAFFLENNIRELCSQYTGTATEMALAVLGKQT